VVMFEVFQKVIRHRELLYMITMRELKVKYKQSFMGVLWALLMPSVIVLAGIFIKIALASLSNKDVVSEDIADISVRAIPWAFVVSSVRFATNSLISNVNLVTKVYMPREIFPLASVLSQFVDFSIAVLTLGIILTIINIEISWTVFFVPLLLLILILFVVGVGMFLAAASLFFRDVKYLVEVFLTFAIFFTPVFYDVSTFHEWANLLLLNPVAPILEGLSSCVVYHQMPSILWIWYSGLVSISIFVGAFSFFKRVEPFFAESI